MARSKGASPTQDTSRIISGNTSKTGNTSQTQESEDAASDADPRRYFYNQLVKLQATAPVKALMRTLTQDKPIIVALSSTSPELELLLTSSGFQLRLDRELVGFFELPMFKAPREGLDGYDYEAIERVVLERAKR